MLFIRCWHPGEEPSLPPLQYSVLYVYVMYATSHSLLLLLPLCRGKHAEVGKLYGATEFMGSEHEYMTASVLRPLDGGANQWVPPEVSAGDVLIVGPKKERMVLVRFVVAGDRRATSPKFRRFILAGACTGEVKHHATAMYHHHFSTHA